MFKDFMAKVEDEQQTPGSIEIQGFINDQSSYFSNFQLLYQTIVEKFYFALIRLQEAQFKEQNQVIPKYPFVFQYSFNEIIVHLGDHKVQLQQSQDSQKYQQKTEKYSEKMSTNHPKLFSQKRKGFSFEDQKDSKNIPKNYCKAIISYALKNQQLCLDILKEELQVAKFLEFLSQQKKKSLNIKVFSSLLQKCDDLSQEEFNKAFRIISQIFIKKYAINYIFNSKIVQHNWHIRYRQKIYKGIKNPKSFSHLKKL